MHSTESVHTMTFLNKYNSFRNIKFHKLFVHLVKSSIKKLLIIHPGVSQIFKLYSISEHNIEVSLSYTFSVVKSHVICVKGFS